VGWLVLAAGASALVVGALVAADVWSPPESPNSRGDVDCTDPPCGPESLPPPDALPQVLPVLLATVAGVLALALCAHALLRGPRPRAGRALAALLLAAGVALVVVGAEIVPHVVSLCWAGEISGVCVATEESGVDYADRLHLLAHAVVGWVPLALVLWWLSRRRLGPG